VSGADRIVIDTRAESGSVFAMPADQDDYAEWLTARYEALKGEQVTIMKTTYRQSLGGVNQAINRAIAGGQAGAAVVAIGPYAFEAADVVEKISKGKVRPKVIV
jgi:2-methylisocitrate lyase-like PEP mutase family enzyme